MFIFDLQTAKDVLAEIMPAGLPPEKEQEVFDKMSDLLQKRLLLRVAADLPGDQKQELDALLQKNDPKEITAFMEKNISNFGALLREEIKKLKAEIKDYLQKQNLNP